MTAATTMAEWLAEFRTARRAFEALVRTIPEERMAAPLAPGGWSPCEIVIHTAAWLAEACERIPAIQAGSPSRAYDGEAFQAAARAAAAGWTPAQAFAAFRRAADRYEAIASDLDDDVLEEEPDVRAWVIAAARVMITEHVGELRRVSAG
jgi:hypothetical protein